LTRTFQQKYCEILEDHGVDVDRLLEIEVKDIKAFIDMHQEKVSQAKKKSVFSITSVISNCEPNFENYDDLRHIRLGRYLMQINEEDL